MLTLPQFFNPSWPQGWPAAVAIRLEMTTREIFKPQQDRRKEAYNRIFVEQKDANDAVGRI